MTELWVSQQSLNSEAYFEQQKRDELTIFLHTKRPFLVIFGLIWKWRSFCRS